MAQELKCRQSDGDNRFPLYADLEFGGKQSRSEEWRVQKRLASHYDSGLPIGVISSATNSAVYVWK